MKQKGDSCNPCYNGYGVHLCCFALPISNSCNPCYNGYGVHRHNGYVTLSRSCNPCYNGYGVHRVIHNVMYLRLL